MACTRNEAFKSIVFFISVVILVAGCGDGITSLALDGSNKLDTAITADSLPVNDCSAPQDYLASDMSLADAHYNSDWTARDISHDSENINDINIAQDGLRDGYLLPDSLSDAAKDAGCSPDATLSCYTGPWETQGVGECKAGIQSCINSQWGACIGQIIPQNEICDNKDNDCDGQIDEDFFSLNQPCTSGVGECKTSGIYQCKLDGSGTECSAKPGSPLTEGCDGKDNDCDGYVDEDSSGYPLVKSCYSGPSGTAGIGQCKAGQQTCANGNWQACVGEVLPKAEACNGLDDDCDNKADEDFTSLGQVCNAGLGECKTTGIFQCKTDGSGTECSAKPGTPTTEICDNKDNDCDGQIDEDLIQSCYTGPSGTQGIGLCKTGLQTCSAGMWGSCTGQVIPANELCDGKDNNCNGEVDEIFSNIGQACSVGIGECKVVSLYQCKADGSGTECPATPSTPTLEVCDGKDNDCDGIIDNIPACAKICKIRSNGINCEFNQFEGQSALIVPGQTAKVGTSCCGTCGCISVQLYYDGFYCWQGVPECDCCNLQGRWLNPYIP